MKIKCPHCAKGLRVQEDQAGKECKCPACSEVFLAVEDTSESTPPIDSDHQQTTGLSFQTLIIVVMAAAAITVAAGFGSGILMTRPQRS